MTINFEPPVAVYSAVRQHTKIVYFNEFTGLEEEFFYNSTEFDDREINGRSYIGAKKFYDPNGAYGGTIKVSSKYPGYYPELMEGLNTAFAERALDDGATVAEDMDARNWQVTFHGVIPATADKFQMRVFIDKVVASNYKNQSTINALETWCEEHIDTI